jgi:hypothetical protein
MYSTYSRTYIGETNKSDLKLHFLLTKLIKMTEKNAFMLCIDGVKKLKGSSMSYQCEFFPYLLTGYVEKTLASETSRL